MWDLPRPGIEPMSLVLEGGFLTTGPQESTICMYMSILFFSHMSILFFSHNWNLPYPQACPLLLPFSLLPPKLELSPGVSLGVGFVPLSVCQYYLHNSLRAAGTIPPSSFCSALSVNNKVSCATKSGRCISASSSFSFWLCLAGPAPLFLQLFLVSGMPLCLNCTTVHRLLCWVSVLDLPTILF